MSLLVWDELSALWQAGEFRAVHDWLNGHWSDIVRDRPEREAEPFSRFLQGLAFAALAFHFATDQNRESAEIFVEDALDRLPRFAPSYAGVAVTPLLDSLAELKHALGTSGDSTIPPVPSSVRALRFVRGAAA